jgi:hypothetical protein
VSGDGEARPGEAALGAADSGAASPEAAAAPSATPRGGRRRRSWLTPERDLRALYYKHFGDRRKERQLFSTGAFFTTFASVRLITHAIRAERGPFRNITPGGYLWLLEIGINEERWGSRATAGAYGAGAALTLDEFALWLNLEDVYWAKQGRESIDAVVIFGSLLSLSVLGKGFLKELLRDA